MEDPLNLVIPEAIPGKLFNAIADDIYDRYPISRRKAEVTAVSVLTKVIEFYEAVVAEEQAHEED